MVSPAMLAGMMSKLSSGRLLDSQEVPFVLAKVLMIWSPRAGDGAEEIINPVDKKPIGS